MNILVTGATGTVGAHVVRELRDRGMSPRAFVRDRERAVAALGDDVELAVGGFADRGSLDRAMRGVDRLFLACGNAPRQVEHERAVIDAARSAGVRRVVKLSGPRPSADSPVVFERWHAEIERHLFRSGLPWVVLCPSTYMTNLLQHAETVRTAGALFAPAGAARIAFVDPRDVAAAAAATLVTNGHERRIHELTGPEAITFEQIAQELAAATGRPIHYVDVPEDAARQSMLDAGLEAEMVDGILAVFALQRAGAMSRVTSTTQALIGRAPGTLARFAREHAALFGAAELVM